MIDTDVLVSAAISHVVPHSPVSDCRDPKDNKFLEAAPAAQADCIISGDGGLRVLHPWRGIEILSPAGDVKYRVVTMRLARRSTLNTNLSPDYHAASPESCRSVEVMNHTRSHALKTGKSD